MGDIAELDTAPDTIEAELVYLADTGEKLITQVAEPGGRDQRQGGDNETHRVKIHNGRPRETQKIRDIVSRVHNDYTEWSGPQRVRDIMGEEAEVLLRGRFAVIQVWRPINNPVESHPLAICDAQTVSPESLVVNERHYPDRIGQTYAITYDPDQRWYWFPHMRPDEALVFKVYESLRDGRARWTAHTAFADPHAPPHARPRESIEIRTLAFF